MANSAKRGEEDRSSAVKKFGFAIGLVIVAIVGILLFTGDVATVVDEESVSATGTFAGATTVKFDDIEEISLESGIDRGKKSFGVDSMKLNAGKFRNDEFGVYNLYAYVDTDVYVVIKYNDEEGEEKYMVVNQEDEKSTHEFYDEVCDAILTHDPDFDGIKE